MSQELSTDRHQARRVSPFRVALNILLAGLGLAFFIYLVRSSGVTVGMLTDLGPGVFTLICVAYTTVVLLDTFAWYYAVAHVVKPRFMPLFGLRIAGDALTNGLPGGVVFGETYKAVMMRAWFGVSLGDNAASLLMVRFGLGFSQALFVLIGLALSYPLLRDQSATILGFEGIQLLVLIATVGMALLMIFPISLMFRGSTFANVGRALKRLPSRRLRAWLEARRERIEAVDTSCREILHGNRRRLTYIFVYLLLGWLISIVESYCLLHFMGLSPTMTMALVFESVGSLFRLIFFMVPSGIGGQDYSFKTLFRFYGFTEAQGGVFMLFKRFRELIWIGLGFVLVLVFRKPTASRRPE
jgi:hypothetical protein